MHRYSCVRCKKGVNKNRYKMQKSYSEVKVAWLKEYCEAIHVDSAVYKFICNKCRRALYTIRKEGNLHHDITAIKKASQQHHHEDKHEEHAQAAPETPQTSAKRQTRAMASRKHSK